MQNILFRFSKLQKDMIDWNNLSNGNMWLDWGSLRCWFLDSAGHLIELSFISFDTSQNIFSESSS